MRRLSRDTAIALAVAALLVVTMAIDHLVGTEVEPREEDAALEDPVAFLAAVGASLVLLGVLFRYVVRRAAADADRAARLAVFCGVAAVLLLALVFLGLPLPAAGAALALGLHGRAGTRRRLATSGVVLGSLVLLVVAVAYVGALVT